ncbi:C-type lectin BfL-2-like [Brienomyrus brachyistius]|uniref:C-type lectin BfL-2-like n=1 Tax=Brienomyrus brachyistius TaxID=42636 RepID=UPI0020B3D883|nr:C-type lectin BfL-2-like [Brienomyrus brachyistius]
MRTPSLLGVALLCLSAMAAAMDNDTLSIEEGQNETSLLKWRCHGRKYRDWYKVGPYCMKYFNTPLSFANAEITCRQKAPGGHLASVHNARANADLIRIVKKRSRGQWSIWLGGMRLCKSSRFIWTDGSHWNFQKWAPGEPNNAWNNENCMEMYIKYIGYWNDFPCEGLRPFVCAFKSHKRQQEPED